MIELKLKDLKKLTKILLKTKNLKNKKYIYVSKHIKLNFN